MFGILTTVLLFPSLRYACTNNNCFGQKDRSVVWVTPVADCDIYIDYNNTGGDYAVFPRKALTSSKFVDKDQDMSGALLFATLPGSGPTGKQVDIAAAWGQDPSVSRDMQSISLDLGTVIRPFPNVRATKSVDKPTAAPGETLIYTIKVMNAGQIDIPGGSMTVFDKLDSAVSYVAGSTVITYNTAGDVLSSAVADSSSPGTPFPLDATGYSIRVPLPKRGGSLDIVFSVLVTGVVNSTEVVNTGHVKPNIGENINFEATTTLIFDPRVVIDNKVYLGSDDGKQCGTDVPQEFVEDIKGAGVVYCFNVTNTGNTHLANLTLDNIPLVYKNTSMGLLAPGNSTMVYLKSKINVGLLNMANVTGTPVFYTGSAIAGLPKVSAKDPSEVRVLIPAPSISIDNEVALGADGSVCGTDVTSEFVEDFVGKDVTYCFNIINTGNTYLDSVAVANTELVFSNSSTGPLMPGESRMVVVKGLIDSALLNNATVVANPVFKDGTDIPDLADVFDSDPSSVGILTRPGDPREIFKPPSSPPGNKTCMDNSYTEAHNVSDQLVCTTNEVYLEKVDSIVAKTCEAGQVITVDVDGSIRFTSARYDLGWYVATDGGDALDGSCAVNGLQKQASYSVVERPGSTKVVGSVNWGKDAKGTLDACGDISTTTAGAGGNIDTPVMVSLSVVCEDENKDGKMDVAICFTWRTSGTDDICTIDRNDPLTKGSLADLYPGEVKGCYCERYNLPNITVVPPTSVVPPC